MSRTGKLLDRMRANTRDWRIEDVMAVCNAHDVACSASAKGSHYKIKHDDHADILTIPAHRPIKPVYTLALVAFIDAVRREA